MTKEKVLNKIEEVMNDFFLTPKDTLIDCHYDNLQSQYNGILYEDCTQEQLITTYNNAVHIHNALNELRNVRFVFG